MKSLLKSDEHYYGEVGKAYLSNSDISALLNDPKSFKADRPLDKNLLQGSLFHKMMIEPDKVSELMIVDASSRNTNIYKKALEESGQEMLLLIEEWREIASCVEAMKSNIDFYSMIYAEGNQYEVPETTTIFGLPWKGKTDILGTDLLIDLKTTSSLSDFKWSAKKYNYDSQAWIYSKLFGKPMVFLVVEKGTGNLGMFSCSPEFYEAGEAKVARACEQYERFFGENATEDVNDYYLNSIL